MDNLLSYGCEELGLELIEGQLNQFDQYYKLLVEWNQKINLTAIVEYEEVVKKHFLDSIAMVSHYDMRKVNQIIDVGTGAGFPGIPIKIIYPHVSVILLDSLKKRTSFLNEVIEFLGLDHIKAVHGRAEERAHIQEFRECYDLCVSRAVARLNVLCEYCLPYVKVGGSFIAYKGPSVEEELLEAKNPISKLGGDHPEILQIQVPYTELKHNIVIINKKKSTDEKYPRKAVKIKKNPLK